MPVTVMVWPASAGAAAGCVDGPVWAWAAPIATSIKAAPVATGLRRNMDCGALTPCFFEDLFTGCLLQRLMGPCGLLAQEHGTR